MWPLKKYAQGTRMATFADSDASSVADPYNPTAGVVNEVNKVYCGSLILENENGTPTWQIDSQAPPIPNRHYDNDPNFR